MPSKIQIDILTISLLVIGITYFVSMLTMRSNTDEDKGFPKKVKIDYDNEFFLYPNPADTTLTVETELTIISYRINDIQGNVYLEGNTPDNNTISVNTLQTVGII